MKLSGLVLASATLDSRTPVKSALTGVVPEGSAPVAFLTINPNRRSGLCPQAQVVETACTKARLCIDAVGGQGRRTCLKTEQPATEVHLSRTAEGPRPSH